LAFPQLGYFSMLITGKTSSTISVLMAAFHVNICWLVAPLALFFHLFQNGTFGTNGIGTLTGRTFFLPSTQQCQITEGTLEALTPTHENRPHWPYPL